MTSTNLLDSYRALSAADSYILGFTYENNLYMISFSELSSDFLKAEKTSKKNGGCLSLRVRLNNTYKVELINAGAKKIDTADILKDDKYNKGEKFEKIVTESYGLEWTKDNIPFYMAGDIEYKGEQIQIKLENATLCTEKSIENIQKKMAAAA